MSGGLVAGQDIQSALGAEDPNSIIQFANTSGVEADSSRIVDAMNTLHANPVAPHLGSAVERAADVNQDAPSVSQEANLNLTQTAKPFIPA